MNELTKLARKLVRVGRDKVGWHVLLANRASKPKVSDWDILSVETEADARDCARTIRRFIVNAIVESRRRG